MKINVTKFVKEAAPRDYSASVAEFGANAGAITWRHAMEDADEYNMLDTEDKRDAFRAYVKGFRAWSDAEIAAWSATECNALFIQFVAEAMREREFIDPDDGGGELYEGSDGETYYYSGA